MKSSNAASTAPTTTTSARSRSSSPRRVLAALASLISCSDGVFECSLGPDELPGLRAWNLVSWVCQLSVHSLFIYCLETFICNINHFIHLFIHFMDMSFHWDVISCHFMSFHVLSCPFMSFHVHSSLFTEWKLLIDKINNLGNKWWRRWSRQRWRRRERAMWSCLVECQLRWIFETSTRGFFAAAVAREPRGRPQGELFINCEDVDVMRVMIDWLKMIMWWWWWWRWWWWWWLWWWYKNIEIARASNKIVCCLH